MLFGHINKLIAISLHSSNSGNFSDSFSEVRSSQLSPFARSFACLLAKTLTRLDVELTSLKQLVKHSVFDVRHSLFTSMH